MRGYRWSLVLAILAAFLVTGAVRASADDSTPACVSYHADGSYSQATCPSPVPAGGIPQCPAPVGIVCQIGAYAGAGGSGGSTLARTGVSVAEEVEIALGLLVLGGGLYWLGTRPTDERRRR